MKRALHIDLVILTYSDYTAGHCRCTDNLQRDRHICMTCITQDWYSVQAPRLPKTHLTGVSVVVQGNGVDIGSCRATAVAAIQKD